MTTRLPLSMTALLLAAGLFLISGCGGGRAGVGTGPQTEERGRGPEGKGGPPPWAPAHGYRAKHQYHYYPSAQVYFDTGRGLYFYYQSGRWQVSAQLPSSVRLHLGHSVTLDMDTDRPYRYHSDVITHYPPGHSDDKGKGKGKDKGKGKPKG